MATATANPMTARISPPFLPSPGDLKQRAGAAAAAAAAHADAVDRAARFPCEAFAAARAERLLSLLVPVELGGEGASVSDVVDVCYVLGRACASTGMVFAMHQIMVAILVRHACGSDWHRRMLRRLSAEQWLLASSTTEGTGGGDLRASACAVRLAGGRMSLETNATVMSYGAEAAAIRTTARRAPDGAASDQVLVALLKNDYRLERLSGWDALGMRGTCSAGFVLKASGEPEQVLPTPYQEIHARSMLPIAHLTWSGVWSGVAAARSSARGRSCATRAAGAVSCRRGRPTSPVPPRRCRRFARSSRRRCSDTRRPRNGRRNSTRSASRPR